MSKKYCKLKFKLNIFIGLIQRARIHRFGDMGSCSFFDLLKIRGPPLIDLFFNGLIGG